MPEDKKKKKQNVNISPMAYIRYKKKAISENKEYLGYGQWKQKRTTGEL